MNLIKISYTYLSNPEHKRKAVITRKPKTSIAVLEEKTLSLTPQINVYESKKTANFANKLEIKVPIAETSQRIRNI